MCTSDSTHEVRGVSGRSKPECGSGSTRFVKLRADVRMRCARGEGEDEGCGASSHLARQGAFSVMPRTRILIPPLLHAYHSLHQQQSAVHGRPTPTSITLSSLPFSRALTLPRPRPAHHSLQIFTPSRSASWPSQRPPSSRPTYVATPKKRS